MRRRTHVGELAVFEAHERIVARMPATVQVGAARFELDRTGRPHRLVGRVEATRFDGAWRVGRHRGDWRIDVVPAGPHGALLTVVVEGWRRRGGDDLAHALTRSLRDRMEEPLLGRPIDLERDDVLTVPVWETAPV